MNPWTYTLPPDSLRGNVILVTGATGDLGSALARAAASYGAQLVLLGRRPRALQRVADTLDSGANPPTLVTLDFLAAQAQHYAQLAEDIDARFGRLDGLVHASAELGPVTALERYPLASWAEVMHVNLNAPFLLLHHCIPLLRKARQASVVLTLSDCCERGTAYSGGFAAANQGLKALMQTLADELEGRVRVNAVVPGPINSRTRRAAYPAENHASLPSPASVLPALLYLLGPDSAGSGYILSRGTEVLDR